MDVTNSTLNVEYEIFSEERSPDQGEMIEECQQPSSDHENSQIEEGKEALLPTIDGHSLGSESESVKNSTIEEAALPETEEKFVDIFTQLAKAKLEGMMSGLLEAMIENLRNGERRSELDVEAAYPSPESESADDAYRCSLSRSSSGIDDRDADVGDGFVALGLRDKNHEWLQQSKDVIVQMIREQFME